MKKLVQVRVVLRVAEVEDGEIGDIDEVDCTVSAANWKRGWDWRQALSTALGEPEGTDAHSVD